MSPAATMSTLGPGAFRRDAVVLTCHLTWTFLLSLPVTLSVAGIAHRRVLLSIQNL